MGLCRYGSGNNNGYPFLEDSGILTTNLNYFRDDVWLRNDVSGGYEPGYYAITYALANFNWRPGSQKILIILTDETPDQGVMTISDAMNACSANGAMLYALTTSYLFLLLLQLRKPLMEPFLILWIILMLSYRNFAACNFKLYNFLSLQQSFLMVLSGMCSLSSNIKV